MLNFFLEPAFFTNPQGIVTEWNRQAEIRFGFSAEEMQGNHFSRLFPENLPETLVQLMEDEVAHMGYLINFHLPQRHKNGAIVECLLSRIRYGPGSPGQVEGDLFLLRNISEMTALQQVVSQERQNLFQQMQAEQTAQEREGLQKILEAILVAVSSGRGLGFNRAFLLLVDEKAQVMRGGLAIGPSSTEEAYAIYSSNRAFHTLLEEIQNYQSRPPHADHRVNLMVGQIEIPLEGLGSRWTTLLHHRPYQVVTPDVLQVDEGPLRWLSLRLQSDHFVVTPLVWQGIPIGLLVADNAINQQPITQEEVKGLTELAEAAAQAIQDVRLLRMAERNTLRLKEAYLAQRKDHEQMLLHERLSGMGWMLAEMTHELRNPLVVVGGYIRRLMQNSKKYPKIQSELEVVAAGVDRLEQILERYASRVKNPHQHQGHADVNQVVESVIAFVKSETVAKRLGIQFTPISAQTLVKIPEVQLFQVLYNLVNNAIEASHHGGRLTLILSRQDDQVLLDITDTGVGMKPSVLAQIFDPFFTTREKGLGLGMSLAKEILETHGGSIGVESLYGAGTTVHMALPV